MAKKDLEVEELPATRNFRLISRRNRRLFGMEDARARAAFVDLPGYHAAKPYCSTCHTWQCEHIDMVTEYLAAEEGTPT